MEPPAGCLVILVPLSASMGEDARVWFSHRLTADGEAEVRDVPKFVAARFLADELIDGLANTVSAGYPLPLDVAVLGYTGAEGATRLVSLLPGDAPAPRLVPLAQVAELPAAPRGREGDPRKWTSPAECAGPAPASAAMAEVHKLVAIWLTGRFTARPPVVVHVTDGNGLDGTYQWVARSIGLLATAYGPARLLHVGFTADAEPALCGTAEALPEPWAALAEVSAELPAEAEGRPARRAVSVNDWSLADAWSALFDLERAEDAVAWTGADADTERFDVASARGMWAQKMGNTPEQWEDAYATEPASGVAAIADGASSGIYCRVWADRLARSFISERPDVRDPLALGKWVLGLRGEWRAAIDYDKLNWSKKAKVDETGAAATLLGLEIGPLAADGTVAWRSFAVGDASLFWVREGKLLGAFPVVAADQFGSAPLLVRSNPGYKTLSLSAAGVCRPGDRFILATDAVAARLFKSTAVGPGPDWDRFETIDETAWREELDVLRKANDMVNDDCTLVSLRVGTGSSGAGGTQAAVAGQESAGAEPPAGVAPPASAAGETADVPTAESGRPAHESPQTPEERNTTRDGFSD